MRGIYRIKNKATGKVYVGQGVLKDREWRHFYRLRVGTHENRILQEEYELYGEESFIFEVIEKCSNLDELDTLEKKYIEKENSYVRGYNLTKGGRGSDGYKHTTEALERMKVTKEGMYLGKENPFYGKKHTEEVKRKLGENARRRFKGIPKTEEHKRRMREGSTLRIPVEVFGERYLSATEASEKTGICRKTILNRARNNKYKEYKILTD